VGSSGTSSTTNERFLREFLLPLIAGGELHVGKPLGAEDVAALLAEAVMPDEALLEVERARQARAAQLWLYPVATPWDQAAVHLAVAAHNVLFLSHPDCESWTASRSKLERVRRFTAELLELPPPASGEEAVARHTLVGNLLELSRVDVKLDTWAMVYSFRGMEPPQRLKRWPGLRRVSEQRRTVRWLADEPLDDVQQALVWGLLRRSPLTDLLMPARPRPAFAWLPVVDYLRWQLLARLVAQRYLELGLDQVGPTLARAFWALVRGEGSAATGGQPGAARRDAVRTALGLITHLHAAACLTGPLELGIDPAEPGASLAVVLAAAAECGALPEREALGAPEVAERVQQIIAGCAPVGTQVIDELAARLRAALE